MAGFAVKAILALMIVVGLLKCNHFPRMHLDVHWCTFRCIPVERGIHGLCIILWNSFDVRCQSNNYIRKINYRCLKLLYRMNAVLYRHEIRTISFAINILRSRLLGTFSFHYLASLQTKAKIHEEKLIAVSMLCELKAIACVSYGALQQSKILL